MRTIENGRRCRQLVALEFAASAVASPKRPELTFVFVAGFVFVSEVVILKASALHEWVEAVMAPGPRSGGGRLAGDTSSA